MNRAMVPPELMEAAPTPLGRFCAEFLRTLESR